MSAPGSGSATGRPVGAAGYWMGSMLMVIGVVIAIVVVVVGVTRAVDAFAFPDVVDASGGVWIDDPGGKVIFVVGPESTTDQFSVVPQVSVTDPDGDSVRTGRYDSSRSTTDVDASTGTTREAVAVATFHADEPGRYHLSATDLPLASTLGVGEGVDGNFGLLGLGLVGGGLLVLVGLILVIVTAVRRHRQQPMPPAGPYAYPYPYQQQYQQQYPYPQPYPRQSPHQPGPPGSPSPPGYPMPPQPGPPVAPPGSPPGPGSIPAAGPAGQWWEAPGPGQAGPR